MPVYEIKAKMPLSEFVGWNKHFNAKQEGVATSKKFDVADPASVLKAFGC